MECTIVDEIECLKSCYDEKEFTSFISNQSQILKFHLQNDAFITFEIPNSYPEIIPLISLSSSNLIKSDKIAIEEQIRNYATELIGSPMVMDLVIRLQEVLEIHRSKSVASVGQTASDQEDCYMAVILIDHIRQRNKYLKALCSWAADLEICGSLVFCQKQIFLFLQGMQRQVKEFIVRQKTTCIDVDSSGKSCKEKMSKILLEKNSLKSFSTFSIQELETIDDLESFLRGMNLERMYQDTIRPLFKC